MPKHTSLWTLLLFLFALNAICMSATADEPVRPNMIVIIADDMAWDDCGAYGHPNIRTPNIDRLAREGMRFSNAFLTCSSCSPSRSSINTGRYPHATGAGELHQSIPGDQVLFASLLKEAGYYTAACGKWHMGNAVKEQYDIVREGGNPAGYGYWLPTLQDRPQDQPFFLWLATTDPHRGYQPNTIEEPHEASDAVVPPYMPDVEATQGDLALYYDEIGRLDLWVGKILDELEAQGVAEETLILFMSDNGRPFPRCKTTVFDSGVQTPFIVRWPAKVEQGTVTDGLVSSVDIAPTFCELAGAEISTTFQGVSFTDQLSDADAPGRDYVYAEHNWHDYRAFERSVRDEQYLYVYNALSETPRTPPADAVRSPTYVAMQQLYAEGGLNDDQLGCFETPIPREQLFDVVADPHQLSDLVADPSHTETLLRLRKQFAAWQRETDDVEPLEDELTPDGFHRELGTRLP
jgi:N-sulfoglucosamine sulfohydrolase